MIKIPGGKPGVFSAYCFARSYSLYIASMKSL